MKNSHNLGSAFSDFLIVEGKTYSRFAKSSDRPWWLGVGRPLLITAAFFIGFFILSVRLFDLTVVQGHTLRVLADENRTRELIRHAPRGILYDRTGKLLVTNIPNFRLIAPCQENSVTCTKLLTKEEGEQMNKKGLPPGSFLEVDYVRNYSYDFATSHVIGYTGELTAKELKSEYYSLRKYRRGDRTGRMGVESSFEEKLRGRDGKELVEVDANGNYIRTLGRDTETPGQDIILSIDAELSKAAYEAFPKDQKGAIIVSKPKTGEILVLFSSPTYSLNTFSSSLSQESFDALFDNPDRPLFNRAIGGEYPPGSTFKIISALAALENGVVTPKTQIEDTGTITLGTFSFSNWYFLQYGKTDGLVDLPRAIGHSNDIYFYRVGEKLGITKLSEMAKTFGIGKPLGIELSGEASGLMPDPAWKAERFNTKEDQKLGNDKWYVGDTYHVSIGQGYLLTTPLQVNTWTNLVADDGSVCKPTILKTNKGKLCRTLTQHKEYIEAIQLGMTQACEAGGTGWPLFDFSIPDPKFSTDNPGESSASAMPRIKIPVACKTGTAEFGDLSSTHAWFTSYAPIPIKKPGDHVYSGDPEISVTVLVEGAGEGSEIAAPIAKKIFEAWFSR